MPVKKNQRNFYRILHVQPDAPLALIQASYRTLMQKLRRHPDLGGDEWDAAILNEAYATLSDECRRSAYDAELFAARTHAQTGRQTSAQRSTQFGARNPPDPGTRQADAATADDEAVSGTHHPWSSAYGTAYVDFCSCTFCGAIFRGVIDAETDCANCQSPLRAVAPLELEASDQRNVHRLPLMSTLTLHTAWPGDPEAAVLHDMSPNGLRFVANPGLALGQRVRISCAAFTAVAEIANHAEHSARHHQYGARFITLRYRVTSGTFVSASV